MTRTRAASSGDRRPAATAAVLWLVAGANGAVVVWLWVHGGGISSAHTTAGLLTSLGRVTALVGTYLVLVQVLLLARIPWLERWVGFDRLTVWHRRNGKVALTLVVAHVPLIVAGYARDVQIGMWAQVRELFVDYPQMVTATVGTGLLIVVVATSLLVVRMRLAYEAWLAVHLTVYAGILLAYLHQVPTGNEFAINAAQRDYWYGLYIATIALLVCFRILVPVRRALRHRLRVSAVHREAPDVVSVYLEGREVDGLHAHGGQFFIWRFLSRGRWWQAHPFSLSAAPDANGLRLTVKAVGGFTRGLQDVVPGTRVFAEGPFGTFTAARAQRPHVTLIAGGIGITPLRAMLDELTAAGRQVTLIHRVQHSQDLIFADELAARELQVHTVVSDHRDPGSARLLSPEHLRELVPRIDDSEVFICGPPAMMRAVRSALRAAGTPARRIHTERFALAASA